MNKRVTILGAGKLGTVLSQLALDAGYEVFIAGSGSPDKIALSVSILSPGAVALESSEAIAKSQIIILALPLSKYRTLPAEALSGKLVVDAMNYWWEVDGHDPELTQPETSTSEIIQSFLKSSRVIKALSHMGYHHLFDEARPRGSEGRKAIAIAGGDESDAAAISQLVDDLGFDPLLIGPLGAGQKLEPGNPAFGANLSLSELSNLINS